MPVIQGQPGRYRGKPVRATTDLLSNATSAIQRSYACDPNTAREVICDAFVNWLELQLAGRDDAEIIARTICREVLTGAQLARKLSVFPDHREADTRPCDVGEPA